MGKLSIKQKNFMILLISVLAVYFFMRFFFTISLPFLFALLTVWKVYPFISKLSLKTKCKEVYFIGIFLFLFLAILVLLLYIPLHNCSQNINILTEKENVLEICVEKYQNIRKICCEYVGDEWIVKIQNQAVNWVKSGITILTYIVIYFISLLLICKDFKEIKNKIKEKRESFLVKIITGVILYIKAFLKTQVLIFLILSVIVGVTLSILKVPYGFILGVATGFLDALPFIGTGIVLVPFCIWFFLKGEMAKAIVVLILYGVCSFIREFLEPKLIGKKVGIYPIVLFASVFVGMQIFGVVGIIKGPLSIVIIYEIRKELLAKEEKLC